jgi:hypothetical protein
MTKRALSFDGLDETDFEEFSFDLLHELKFVNIDWRKGTGKKTSPSDRGRDIVCQEFRTDIDGSVHLETWFVDCKHFKKGIPPLELQNLLTWAEAERPHVALIIASNFLSNPAKDYLEDYRRNRKPPFKIKVWEKPTLEKLASRKLNLLRKYNLANIPIRNIQAILKAEHEFFDKVWYDRHQMLRHLEKIGKEKTHPDIMKAARKVAKAVEKKYGRKNLGPHNDFEWGMINGKLSALRWVLGDEWDMLDT